MIFLVHAWRFRMRAVDPVHFPPGMAGNVLRGAFGTEFRRLAAAEKKDDLYLRFFEPRMPDGPSGFADAPRPFVFRGAHLDGRTFRPGEPFHFDVHIFDVHDPALWYFSGAFEAAAQAGIGANRGRATLDGLEPIEGDGVVAVPLDRGPEAATIEVTFATPTELKDGGGVAPQPKFSILFARARDRVSILSRLYGGVSLTPPILHPCGNADAIQLVRCEVRHVAAQRRSSRTGQTHPIGGFAGQAVYSGDLTPFLPLLKAAEWTGVGRQTVWGKGAIRIRILSPRQ